VTERKLDDLEAAIAKTIEEDPVARSADHELELVPREMLDQIPDVLGPAAGARRHQELENADGLFHIVTRAAASSCYRSSRPLTSGSTRARILPTASCSTSAGTRPMRLAFRTRQSRLLI
jgi:hypothetical protein